MFAVVETGGKQYRVQKGDVVVVEKLEAEAGKKVVLDQVKALTDGDKTKIGAPLVAGASVEAEVIEQKKDKKIMIFKKRRRQNSRRKNGHRQMITVLKVTGIKAAKAAKAAAEAKA